MTRAVATAGGARWVWVAVCLTVSVAVLVGPSLAEEPPEGPRTFADVPPPGEPWGLVTHRGRVYTSTAGSPTGGQPPEERLQDWRVFAYEVESGKLDAKRTTLIPRLRPVSFMGLAGIDVGPDGLLYVADMNGRILRVDPRKRSHEVYATIPVLSMADSLVTMPFDLVFDPAGNLYIADGGAPGIWRVKPDRTVELWYLDPKLFSWPPWFGLLSITLAPKGDELFFGMCQSRQPSSRLTSIIYRLPIKDPPNPKELTEFHRYGTLVGACPRGLEFGASGRLYVGLGTPGQIQVLSPDGDEIAPRFNVPGPAGLAFDGAGALLVASAGFGFVEPPTDKIFSVFVGDTAVVRPRGGGQR